MFENLKELICSYVEINPEEITENSRFSEDLGFNSYDFVSMLGDAEEEFGIEISQDEAS
ncbi:MAG: acyl carrier protein, partial [Oscillospiraceae bacterium]|nr:acyl carrier protein [Oscillospiraceae bacterium]